MDAFLRGTTAHTSSTKQKQSAETSAGTSGKRTSVPWVEKYRPKSVDDVACQEEVVSVLRKAVEGADFSHMLFYGPPGTGKTSTILAIARQLFGTELMGSRVLELNASDERGIDVIRNKVKRFSQFTAAAVRPDGKPCPSFKLVILDEADSMTPSAQAALRRTMERETKTTRFCLICNYVSRIIEPLTSRCSKFRFKPLATKVLERRLKQICEMEEVKFDEEALHEVVNLSEGDMRKAITFLQSAHRLKGDEGIHAEDITNIAGVVPRPLMDDLFKTCHSNSYDRLDTCIKEIIAEGFPASQLISQIHDSITQLAELTDHQKSAIAEKLAVVDRCLMDGADEYLQVLSLCSVIMQQFCQTAQ